MNKIKKIIINIKRLVKNWKEYTYLRKLFKNCVRTNILKGKTIVFNTVKTKREFIDREMFYATIFAINGAKVKVLLDDGLLNHWETTVEKDRKWGWKLFAFKILKRKGLRTYKDKNLEVLWYNKFNIYTHYFGKYFDEVKKKIFKHAKASTIRYFKTEQLDWDNSDVKDYFSKSMENCIYTIDIGNHVINKYNPDYFFTSHGIYSIWGQMLDEMRNKGVKSYIFVRGHSHTPNGSEVYLSDVPAQILSRSKFWKEFNKKYDKLPEHLESKVAERMEKRFKHLTMDTEIYQNTDESKLLSENKNPNIKYNIAIFPNVVWDGNIVERHGAFEGLMDWLISTLNYLKTQKDVMIYIRFHPAEATLFKEKEMTQNILKENIDLDGIKNLRIIKSEDRLDSYLLVKSGIDLAINYDTMMNLELPYLKVPVLCGATGGRFTIDDGDFTIKDKDDYFDKLKNFRELVQYFKDNYDKYYNNIVKYAYWYLFVIPFRHPVVKVGNRNVIDLRSVTKEDLVIPDPFLEILDVHETIISEYKYIFYNNLRNKCKICGIEIPSGKICIKCNYIMHQRDRD